VTDARGAAASRRIRTYDRPPLAVEERSAIERNAHGCAAHTMLTNS
jgi:hypothetical protein